MIQYGLNPLGINKTELSDLDVLRQIRDANPSSQLPSVWLDSKNPYTQWDGVTWDEGRVSILDIRHLNVNTIPIINRLTNIIGLYCNYNNLNSIDISNLNRIEYIDCFNNNLNYINAKNCSNLFSIYCKNNKLIHIDISGCMQLQHIDFSYNNLTSIDTLTSKLNIWDYNFTYNNFTTAELNRFRAMGFTDESKLLPQK